MAMNSTSNSAKPCPFCGKVFSENNELWKHITSGTCNVDTKAEPVQSPAPRDVFSDPVLPKSVAQADSNLELKNALARNGIKSSQNGSPDVCGLETPPKREIEPFTQPPLLPTAPRNPVLLQPTSKDADHVFRDPPTQSSHSPSSTSCNIATSARMMPQTNEAKVAAESPRVSSPLSALSLSVPTAVPAAAGYGRSSNLSVKSESPFGRVSSQPGTLASVPDDLSSKWKCTLCDIEFLDKSAMVSHVRSQEHEARIQFVKRSAGDAPLPKLSLRESTSPGSLPKDELVEIVRQVVAEELPALLRSELRAIFSAALKEPLKENASVGRVASSSSPEVKLDTQSISTCGNSIRCKVCDCPITSPANVSIHLEGKKHKANLAKLENGRGVT